MGLKKLIFTQANEEAQTILTTAKKEKETLLEELNANSDKKVEVLLSDAKKDNAKKIAEKKLEFEHEKKRLILQEKNTQIERVLSELRDRILNLNDQELFNYVVKLLKNEKIKGDETILVNKNDYNRYLKVFSSANKKAEVVELDLLNKKLGKGFNLKLEQKPAAIDDGFMLIGEFYDLNFSVEPQIEKIKRVYEREIHNILYE